MERPEQTFSPAQVRAARGLLGWSQQQLADRSEVTRRTIAAFELDGPNISPSSLRAILTALEEAGIEFIGEGRTEGVRRRGE